MNKIYLSASTQEHNIGVSNYGSEETNMFKLRGRAEYFIKNGGHGKYFTIYKNSDKSWSLSKIVSDSNSKKPALHAAFHTNAGSKSARGCEVYHYYKNTGTGKKFAGLWYDEISKVTPSADRGVKKDNVLYSNGLYELRETTAAAALCEFIFHTNEADVKFFQSNIDKFAIGTAKAIYKLFGYTFTMPGTGTTDKKVKYIVQAGAFSELKNAETLVKKLNSKGFDALIKKV